MHDDPLSLVFFALADPTRRALLERLSTGEANVGELAEPFHMSTQAISKHIAVLEAAGLVTRGRDAQRRPSLIQFAPLRAVDDWLDRYRLLWLERLGNLDRQLSKNQGRGSNDV
ncbi:DNA-binding transcriptional ArsR family regulator [Devosia sp. UYZn731]|uniref:ArsR/SmtB family transcription factor n=1 Tax=Devosia sp. UYZn731 TaxID=3156345 RepID=UPI00339187D3